jgi:hypothetical protein
MSHLTMGVDSEAVKLAGAPRMPARHCSRAQIDIELRSAIMRRIAIVSAMLIVVGILICGATSARADGIILGRVEWTSPNGILDYRAQQGDEHQIYVDPQARITHNGRPIQLGQLKLGWDITIQYVDTDKGPVAIAIAAVSKFGAVAGHNL